MKKIYIALTCMSILGGTTACSDFLEENPKSEISSSQYFTQPDHARAAVNKLYRSGVPQFYDADAYAGSKMMYGGYMSGFFDNEKKAQEEWYVIASLFPILRKICPVQSKNCGMIVMSGFRMQIRLSSIFRQLPDWKRQRERV